MTGRNAGPGASPAEKLARLPSSRRAAVLAQLPAEDCRALFYDWSFWARPGQRTPEGPWFCWLVLAGRGFGKTRMGAEWVRAQMEGPTPLTAAPGTAGRRLALIGETWADVRGVMVEGDSGILACSPPDRRPVFEPSRRRLTWANGAVAEIFAAAEPDQLRGPQHHLAWADEIAKWPAGDVAWANLLMGLRLGDAPRVMATTTPRPLAWLKRLANDPNTVVTRGGTLDNRAHLARPFLAEMERQYGRTRIGRQELGGEILEDAEGALWTRALIEDQRVARAPGSCRRTVVAVDPPVTGHKGSDACGIVIAALGEDGRAYVLEDATLARASPATWMARALALYGRYDADRLVAEVNNGGDLVETLVRQMAPETAYRPVRASHGKIARAEPVAALYERGLVAHVGAWPELEDQMCRFTGQPGETSPDRLDALVWALTELMLTPGGRPQVRRL
ncbi:putative phage terminase large subunit-like protein [Rhodothalassium salexigens DSM 2132]|uniref:Putative phage terminase large subunit-like protein n=1 Tax=Rhodothalassium salexigens DSM 2132 TaxID=1188247 RepID=A0A4R2PN51_RHOSA|nr:terminase family protein [Rhodothalassium salexigens]MBB4210988.1 putative phage terminase large subunit-like protein [Rhodothalassium salexigens DSM 2132]MBK1638719.1 ATP-binding protein [Rhodothalassium salexigens DSM 2132]TCP36354.1 putative phage terminase large subunit-like protein [Rhodothalassium salexigens DSM 2132]